MIIELTNLYKTHTLRLANVVSVKEIRVINSDRVEINFITDDSSNYIRVFEILKVEKIEESTDLILHAQIGSMIVMIREIPGDKKKENISISSL